MRNAKANINDIIAESRRILEESRKRIHKEDEDSADKDKETDVTEDSEDDEKEVTESKKSRKRVRKEDADTETDEKEVSEDSEDDEKEVTESDDEDEKEVSEDSEDDEKEVSESKKSRKRVRKEDKDSEDDEKAFGESDDEDEKEVTESKKSRKRVRKEDHDDLGDSWSKDQLDGMAEDDEDEDKTPKVTAESIRVKYSDKLNTLFGNLSESKEASEVKGVLEQSQEVFLAIVANAINESSKASHASLGKRYKKLFESRVNSLVSRNQKYMDSFLSTWAEENKPILESNARTYIANSIIEDLKNVLDNNYISVPEQKLDILDTITKELEESTKHRNEAMNTIIDLTEEIQSLRKSNIIKEYLEEKNLSDVEKNKISVIAEELSYKTEKDFKNSLGSLVETLTSSKKSKNKTDLTEDKLIVNKNKEVVTEETPGDYFAKFMKKPS